MNNQVPSSGKSFPMKYMNDYMKWSWDNYSSLDEDCKMGLCAITIALLDAHLEGIASKYLARRLFHMDTLLPNDQKEEWEPQVENNKRPANLRQLTEIDISPELEMRKRLKKQYDKEEKTGSLSDYKRNIFKRLVSLSHSDINRYCKLICGESRDQIVIGSLNNSWTALNKLRNIIAHGREIRTEYLDSNMDFDAIDDMYLSNVIRELQRNGLFPKVHDSPNISPINYLFSKDSVNYFYEKAMEIDAVFRTRYDNSLPPSFPLSYLPNLPQLQLVDN